MKQKSTILNRKRLVLFVCAVLFGIASSAWGAVSDYYGTYAGTFSGDDSGYWVASFDSSESVFLSYSITSGYGDGGGLSISESGDSAVFSGYSEMNDTYISGSITSTGSVTGTWAETYDSGDFSGSPITSLSYAGTYSGTISGDSSGTCVMTIGEDGYISGSVSSGGETFGFIGGAHPNGYVIVAGEDNDDYVFVVFGTNSGSTISGSWYSESGYDGSFTVSIGGTSGGDDGDDGGGGCFINSLF